MNHEESIKSKILGRFFRKMLTAGVLCMGVLVGCLVLGKSILGSFTWYGNEGVYPMLVKFPCCTGFQRIRRSLL